MYTATRATHKLARLRKRIRLAAGGTSAGKTIGILELLIDDALTDVTPTLTSVVSESFPHLRRGSMRDFEAIMRQHGYWRESAWSRSDFVYTFPLIDQKDHHVISNEGSKLEFFSADQPGKVRGPRRDRLFCNEANNIPKEAWEQLLIRTREYAFADWNPVSDFYMYEDYGLNDDPLATTTDPDTDFVILTYKDNEALESAIVNEVEKRRTNKQWYRVYGEGKRGELNARIFRDWAIIDEIPHEARLEVRGMDFGYAQDPNAICDIYYYNGGYIIDQLAYRTGMLERDTADLLLNQPQPNVLTIADSAEPKAIAQLQEFGVNVIGVVKRPGVGGENFTNAAIKFVQGQRMSITKRSLEFIKSYRGFMWQTDPKDPDRFLPKYDHFLSDGMMSVIYGMTNFNTARRFEDEGSFSTGNITSLWG